jgi:hypothetical protein
MCRTGGLDLAQQHWRPVLRCYISPKKRVMARLFRLEFAATVSRKLKHLILRFGKVQAQSEIVD